jgi:hypothetical protein
MRRPTLERLDPRQLGRRILLRGLGGAVVAAPFLGSVGDRSARAQAVPAPKRLIAMFTHYGCRTTRFFPTVFDGQLSAADLEATTLKPLARHAGKVLMPRGIRAMNEWTSGLTRGQGNDPHLQVAASYFTCHPVTPNSDEPFSFNTATKFEALPLGPSLDHVIAQQLSPQGTPLYLRVGNRTESPQSAISYSAPQQAYAGVGLPSATFSSLTGLFTDGAPVSPDSYAVLRGKSVLDIVRDDLETLERFDMSASDKLKLAAWKELLDQTGTVMASEQCTTALATELGVTRENVDAVGTADGTTDTLTRPVNGTTLDEADIYSNVAVLAAACNYNPVIFLKYPAMYVFGGLGLSIESHTLSHRVANANMVGLCVTNAMEMIETIDAYYARKFAHLVTALDGIEEGEGTLLDNCAAVWFQEMSDGNAHNLNNLPIVQAGSAGGYFKTGCAVNLDPLGGDPTAGNSDYFCEVDSLPIGTVETTGTPPGLANAPINKYFVNLMNALGVRAGEDGFAAPNGQAEVTRFGMYDRTEDFIGGGVNPPMIHSPGGFEALKASS